MAIRTLHKQLSDLERRVEIRAKDKDERIAKHWRNNFARPEQIIDPEHGNVLLQTGRRFGKTRAEVEFIREEVEWRKSVERLAIVVPDFKHIKTILRTMQKCYPTTSVPTYSNLYGTLTFPRAPEVTCDVVSANRREQARGFEYDLVLFDELAYYIHPEEMFEDIAISLDGGGSDLRWVVATTPPVMVENVQAIQFLKKLREVADTFVVGTTLDNPELNQDAIDRYKEICGGEDSVRWRVEGLGELIDTPPDALFFAENIAENKVLTHPELVRVVVAVDPAMSAKESSDETGIIVAGVDEDGTIYILADYSGRFDADVVVDRIKRAVVSYGAYTIVVETNQGGYFVTHAIDNVDIPASVETIQALDSKQARAWPVSALYKRGKVKHMPGLTTLESQMINWSPNLKGSGVDDRLDALVYAATTLAFDVDVDVDTWI